jgi:hypothetical protein
MRFPKLLADHEATPQLADTIARRVQPYQPDATTFCHHDLPAQIAPDGVNIGYHAYEGTGVTEPWFRSCSLVAATCSRSHCPDAA